MVAGGAVGGVIVAILFAVPAVSAVVEKLSVEHGMKAALGETGFFILGVAFFALMGSTLYRVALKK